MSDCPDCTEEDYCSDACMEADEQCLHDEIEDLVLQQKIDKVEIWLSRCLLCNEMISHHYVGSVHG